MNLLSEELFVPSVKILLFYCLNIRTFANETNRRRNALSVRIQTEQVKKRELITPCNRPVRLIYCESGIETIVILFIIFYRFVRLIYCESGIETNGGRVAVAISIVVRLIYCESGIETQKTLF